jgi:hypothetical protein
MLAVGLHGLTYYKIRNGWTTVIPGNGNLCREIHASGASSEIDMIAIRKAYIGAWHNIMDQIFWFSDSFVTQLSSVVHPRVAPKITRNKVHSIGD